MRDGNVCPFYNIGYCKYKTKCLKEHAKIDCLIEGCKDKSCYKRHRKPCRYGNKCTYQQKNSCEFKHNAESVKVQIDQIKKEANKTKNKSESLKLQIEELKKTVHKQKQSLTRLNLMKQKANCLTLIK